MICICIESVKLDCRSCNRHGHAPAPAAAAAELGAVDADDHTPLARRLTLSIQQIASVKHFETRRRQCFQGIHVVLVAENAAWAKSKKIRAAAPLLAFLVERVRAAAGDG